MSAVVEVTPASCPACGADWTVPKSHRPGWGYVPTEGNYGHRTWECTSCGHLERPGWVELRSTPPWEWGTRAEGRGKSGVSQEILYTETDILLT